MDSSYSIVGSDLGSESDQRQPGETPTISGASDSDSGWDDRETQKQHVSGIKSKIVVVGAGPVGALAAIYAADRGFEVEVYELRNDLRDPSTTPLNFTRSINLALSERGINALRASGRHALLERIMAATIPMRGRMIHGKKASGSLYEDSQDYDIHGRTIFAVDRGGLNAQLLDELESMPNVKIFFNHKLVGANFADNKAWLETKSPAGDRQEVEITFDLLIGADGAHSATRYHLMKYTRMDYKQEYIDTLWCEFTIPPNANPTATSKHSISPNHLHIWPGSDRMFIAIPSLDGSFTCTLFLPSAEFSRLATTPDTIPSFFNTSFPGVTALIPPTSLITQFNTNPHLPLISLTCSPYHFRASAVILGDAAHAMVPFYGQGMNAGLEDVRVLFDLLPLSTPTPEALDRYTALRAPDAAAISALALANYVEMREGVVSPLYKLRKRLEETLSHYFPALGWATQYSRVSFGNMRYSEVVEASRHQGNVILATGALVVPVIGVAVWMARGGVKCYTRAVLGMICGRVCGRRR
ncbi:kynurenine 3-monooxygenase, mitochondrial precursor [Pseudogymnoascus australis]